MKELINYLYPVILIAFPMGCTPENEQETKTPQEHFPTLEESEAAMDEVLKSIDARQPYGHIPEDQRLDYGYYIPVRTYDSVVAGHFVVSYFDEYIGLFRHEEYPIGFLYTDLDLYWPTEWKAGNYISTFEDEVRQYTYHKVGKYNKMSVTDENGKEEMWTRISWSRDDKEFFSFDGDKFLEKYYFSGGQEVLAVKTDSVFTLNLDENGKVWDSENWEKYGFSYSEEDMSFGVTYSDGRREAFFFELGSDASFSLFECLYDEPYSSENPGKGDLVYQFKRTSRPEYTTWGVGANKADQ